MTVTAVSLCLVITVDLSFCKMAPRATDEMRRVEPGQVPDTLLNPTVPGPALCVASFLVNASTDWQGREVAW